MVVARFASRSTGITPRIEIGQLLVGKRVRKGKVRVEDPVSWEKYGIRDNGRPKILMSACEMKNIDGRPWTDPWARCKGAEVSYRAEVRSRYV